VTLEETNCFKMLDEYSRTRHRCFLAEMDLNAFQAYYSLCFRPTGGTEDSPNRYACLYLRINAEEVKNAGKQQVLPASITQMLDRELPTLPQS
jgi:hypothetical protein